jgi:alpha-mannosidase
MDALSDSQLIDNAITRLRHFSERNLQSQWRRYDGNLPPAQACDPNGYDGWEAVILDERGHVAWPQGQQHLWLGQIIQLPPALFEYPLRGLTIRLALRWWSEQAEIYVNGTLVQEGDLFDCAARVLLTEALVPEVPITVTIHLVSPGHDLGALVQSTLIYEPPLAQEVDGQAVDPGMVASELEVLKLYLAAFQPSALPQVAIALEKLSWPDHESAKAFQESLKSIRFALQPWGDWLKRRQIHWLGHAHLDLAWLWPVAETWEVAERTFQSALNLQNDFAELIFCHSSPALYDWMQQHRPKLFAQIQQRVREGRWEVAAGLWVEPELNLISGESIVRQILYGQRYTQQQFGHISQVAWLPDSFGFCWQLPQLLKQGGIQYFLTQKLSWNDTTQFPYGTFWWQGPDGTRLFSVMTPLIGESMDPLKMGRYAQDWEARTHCPESFWLPGVGDHGGGPTRDMLEVARRWQKSPLFPRLKPSTMTAFCQHLEEMLQDIPIWEDELYLEFHRGCYTSHADQKYYNRRCEHWLTEAELFSAIATLLTQVPYPKADLEAAWKMMLFNQFHDILPGSAIPEVFSDANQDWEQVQQTALQLRQAALQVITTQIQYSEPPIPDAVPIVVYNSLNWERTEVASWQLPDHLSAADNTWAVWDEQGSPRPSHCVGRTLYFWADEIPALGFRTFWYTPGELQPTQPPRRDWILDNGLLRVEVCAETGALKSIWDEVAQRMVLAGTGNQLQFFQDQGQYWDAWNIDPNYGQHPLECATLKSITWVSQNSLQQRLRVVRQWRQSVFQQDYVLDWGSPILKIETQVDWQETHVLVKAAFPLNLSANHATYEMPCGAIERPTLPNPEPLTQHQQTKWEVPALQWADLSQSGEDIYGVSLLNDCKYGYDAQPNCLRLTLLRSPTWPDPNCDRGSHQFTYALYPHQGSWESAATVHRGYELNRPLLVQSGPAAHSSGYLPSRQSFIWGFPENLVLMAFKQTEDSPQDWVIRCYEACGQPTPLNLETTLPLELVDRLDGLERPISQPANRINPWQVQAQRWTQHINQDKPRSRMNRE